MKFKLDENLGTQGKALLDAETKLCVPRLSARSRRQVRTLARRCCER